MSNVSKRVTKISAIKYFAIMGMVCLHTTFILEENSIPEVLISSIAGIGLPLFFWLSGYFYFNKYKVSRNTQIISKVKRILVPYLIWQIVAILMIVSIQMMGFSCPHSIPSSLLQILESIVLGKNNAPLWYLRVVFVLFMLSPALIELMEIEEKIAGGGIIVLLILNVLLYHNIQYASVQYWIPTYLASGFFSLYCPDYIAKRKGDTQMLRSLIIMVSLWLVLVFMRIFGIRGVSYYKYVMWFCAPYFLIDISEIFGTSDHAIYESEFFLYCAHQPVIYCIEAVVRRFAAPETQNERAMAYIIVVAATIGVCSIAYFLLSKTRKRKILKLLYGLW